MTNQIQHSKRSAGLGAALVAAILAGGALFGASAPARAQSTSWEEGCAMRMVTPGPGDILRTMNCDRQKMCQQMANAKGGMMMDMGCFFVGPRAGAPTAQVGRSRPTQQQ